MDRPSSECRLVSRRSSAAVDAMGTLLLWPMLLWSATVLLIATLIATLFVTVAAADRRANEASACESE